MPKMQSQLLGKIQKPASRLRRNMPKMQTLKSMPKKSTVPKMQKVKVRIENSTMSKKMQNKVASFTHVWKGPYHIFTYVTFACIGNL